MKYGNPKFYLLSQVIVAVIVLLIVVSLLWNAAVIESKQAELEQLKVESHLETTSYEISLMISELRRDLHLFAQAHRQQIKQLAAGGELDQLHGRLLDKLKKNFKHAFALTIADTEGTVLLEDYDGFVQEVCQAGIQEYAGHSEHPELVVHPNPMGYHFDLMTMLEIESENLIVFASFHLDAIVEILQRGRLQDYRTLIVNSSQPELIEITDQGGRDKLLGNHLIDEVIKQRIVDTVAIDGSRWLLTTYRDESQLSGSINLRDQTRWIVAGFLLIGVLAILLLQKFKLHLVAQSTRIQEQSLEISRGAERLKAMFSSVLDGIVTIDRRGRITDFNPASEEIFGYRREEVLGKNVNMLMPEPYHDEHDQYLKNYYETGVPKVIGIGREMEGRRKDGTTFPMDLSVTEVKHGSDGEFVGLVRDITERKRIQTMKDEFVSTVSHELRTPLTSIRGSLGLIQGGKLGELPDAIGKLMNIAITNTDRLVRLINDILDVEKIESGKMHFEFRLMPIEDVVTRAIDNISGMAQDAGIVIDSRIDDQQHIVSVDEDRMIQVVVNLLSNAIKFSEPGSRVSIAVEDVDGSVQVAVNNRGRGIAAEDKGRIFQKFSQVDSSDSRDKGGSGLGLSISKSIIEKHLGTIGFTSEPGKETVFYFKLPYGVVSKSDIDEQVADDAVNRMLVIEDDADVAHLLSMMLAQQNIKSDIAHDADQAKQCLARHEYIAATLDIMLPGQDGISLYRDIRANSKTAELPIIIVSAKANETKKELDGDALYIIDWINKPIDQQRLYELLSVLTRRGSDEKPRILHIEDDEEHAILVQGILSEQGEIIQSTSIADSKQRLREDHVDLVILDLNLPDGHGTEVCDYMRRTGKSNIPVIVFSANEIDSDIRMDVVEKLVKATTTNEQLAETVKAVINR